MLHPNTLKKLVHNKLVLDDLSNQSWPTKLQLLQLQRMVSQENCDVYSSWVLSFKDLLENEEYYGNTGCGFQTGGIKLCKLHMLVQFSKFKNFLWVCWILGKNLSNFIPPIWKLHTPYCHIMMSDADSLGYGRILKKSENNP